MPKDLLRFKPIDGGSGSKVQVCRSRPGSIMARIYVTLGGDQIQDDGSTLLIFDTEEARKFAKQLLKSCGAVTSE